MTVHKTEQLVTAEFRIPWTDLPTDAKLHDELLLNIATFPKLDSKTPSHVSSPWLIGTSPTYNPAYYGTVRFIGRRIFRATSICRIALPVSDESMGNRMPD